jgi:putative sugar O-methyltransferase
MSIKSEIKKFLLTKFRKKDVIFLSEKLAYQINGFEEAVNEINARIELATPESNSLIHKTWSVFSQNIRKEFLSNPRIDFFSTPVFMSTMTGLSFFSKNKIYIEKIEQIFGRTNCSFILEEDLIGQPVLLRNCKYRTSLNRLIHAYQMALSIENAPFISDRDYKFTVTEWGGGFGGLARIFKKYYPNCTYNIIDIEEVSFVQYIYLRGILGKNKVILHNGFSKLIENAINLIPNSYLHKYIDLLNCDIFISSWALSESNKESQVLVKNTHFFNSKKALIIHQPKSEVHPFSEDIMLQELYGKITTAKFPYMNNQTIIQASKI